MCRFGGILLHADRFKHINNVARMLLQETGVGTKVTHVPISVQCNECQSRIYNHACVLLLYLAQGGCQEGQVKREKD